ncbi:uncharacterized protein METZ01_LOCUS205500 [marine metagenome]|uniref:Uncharacterized protein n=1 Tax=marine metagenome TaxID=408172 RepID=A0A382EPC2_9ZZZZ
MSYTIPDWGVSPHQISVKEDRIHLSKKPRDTPKNSGTYFCLMKRRSVLIMLGFSEK